MSDERATEAIVPAGEEGAGAPSSVESGPGRRLGLVLARSALLGGLTRFVPVPLLDDYLEAKVRHHMVHSLLRMAGRTYRSGHLAPLWEGAEGCLGGCVGFVLRLPWTLTVKLVKKLFKTFLVVLVVREAALHVAETLLLGRAVHRLLSAGAWPEGKQHEPGLALREEAREVRRAFDRAFSGADLRLLRQALEEVLRRVSGLPRAGARAVRAMFGGKKTDAEAPRDLPEAARPAVDSGVEEVEAALAHPEVAGFLEEFDRRFDEALAAVRGRAAEEPREDAGS